MKTLINCAIFLFVLMLPFALSSQTRKAIPAGRYESLSGVKVSHSNVLDSSLISSSQSTIWQEVSKNLSMEKNDFYYLKNYGQELNLQILLPAKNFRVITKPKQEFDLLITDDLSKEKENLKQLRAKGLVVFISSKTIGEIMPIIGALELLVYQNQGEENYYLLKSK